MSTPVLNSNTPSGSFVSDRHANPLLGGGVQAKKENFTWAAALAIITTLLFLALLAMQWMDFEALKAV